jgi:NAD(P)-dependent dehydrogenase (short-subunit alcohol dehydrogenase family)
MPTVLITGANRGLGLEFARQYAADGFSVIACCREPEQAAELQGLDGDITRLALDVTRGDEIAALAGHLDGASVDLLINNAGVYGPKPCNLDDIDPAAWDAVMRANVYAPLMVSRALLANVAAAKGTIATLSSKMGSIADNSSGGSYIYRSSKAALNAALKSLAHDVADSGVSVVILHPGWVRTDMGGPQGLIDAPESVSGMRAVIAETTIDNTGRFMAFDGKEIPW